MRAQYSAYRNGQNHGYANKQCIFTLFEPLYYYYVMAPTRLVPMSSVLLTYKPWCKCYRKGLRRAGETTLNIC